MAAGSAPGAGGRAGNESGWAGPSPAAGASGVPGAMAQPAMPPHVPRLVPPSVITQAGTEYPADAFRLTVRRQDLGTTFVFDGAEGTVGVRALVLADGTVAKCWIAQRPRRFAGGAFCPRRATTSRSTPT